MGLSYDAFLIRYWSLDDEQGERAELTHLKTGSRICVASLGEAMAWIRAQEGKTPARREVRTRDQPTDEGEVSQDVAVDRR